jgi:hypothetical protein
LFLCFGQLSPSAGCYRNDEGFYCPIIYHWSYFRVCITRFLRRLLPLRTLWKFVVIFQRLASRSWQIWTDLRALMRGSLSKTSATNCGSGAKEDILKSSSHGLALSWFFFGERVCPWVDTLDCVVDW